MAVDVSKFGVPLPGGARQGMLHPKQGYRFRVLLFNFGFDVDTRTLSHEVMSVTRPNHNQAPVAIHSYNTTAYIASKHDWNSVSITVRDDITNQVVTSIGSQIQKQINHYEQTSAVAGINYKFDMEIHSLDGTNNEELEKWELVGCFLESVEYPDGSYDNSDPLTVSMTVRYDEAVQTGGNNTNGGTTTGPGQTIFPNEASPSGGSSIA